MRLTVVLFAAFIYSVSCYGNYYDLSNEINNGSELRSTLLGEDDSIFVTIWFDHLRNNEFQIQRNMMIQTSLKDLISRCHPKVMYTEADVSGYNKNAKSFKDEATRWGLQLTDLRDGPIIMVVYDCHGENFWGSASAKPYNIIHTVDTYIRNLETTYFNNEAPEWEIKIDDSVYDKKFEDIDPWKDYDENQAEEAEKTEPEEDEDKDNFELSEPEKSFF